jgi:sucrose-6-phosphate hydrolase SacC (GH32 family)
MNPHPLRIRSILNSKEYGCQKITLNGGNLSGMLECPDMFVLPAEDDRLFEVMPLGFKIRITDQNKEPKQPSFTVILPSS